MEVVSRDVNTKILHFQRRCQDEQGATLGISRELLRIRACGRSEKEEAVKGSSGRGV